MFAPKAVATPGKVTTSSANSSTLKPARPLMPGPDPALGFDAHKSLRRSWNFANIPIFPPRQPNSLEASPRPPTSPLPSALPPKLVVGRVDDAAEDEANRVAEHVSEKRVPPGGNRAPQWISRLSRRPHEPIGAAAPGVENALGNPGMPLDAALRHDMEQRFGHDFSRVRLHTDTAAGISARQLDANAYTCGYHIVFGFGRFAPATPAGRRLLAHELSHVVQQAPESTGFQHMLIQRDGPGKHEDITKERTEALLNFKDDWANNFSHYDRLIRFSEVKYHEHQKEAIKAVPHDHLLTITLGKLYSTESDEPTRWQWIKTEIIDKHVKTDRFEDIAYDPTHSKIHEINPPYAVGQYCQLNCPATAAALDHFLRTGDVSPAICNPQKENIPGYGFDISKDSFSTAVSWDRAEKIIRAQLKNHGEFVIVQAIRSQEQMKRLTRDHYFSVVNVKGKLFVIDASEEGNVTDNLKYYIDNVAVATTYRIVKGEFKVKEVMPKE
jgi:Domain of unknown function (DUF4157)